MTFVQLITFETDSLDPVLSGDQGWLDATAGRRTLQHSAVYRDVHQANRYVAYNAFPDRAAAAVNSALPETDAMAAEMGRLLGTPTFTDLELVGEEWDVTDEIAARFRRMFETSGAADLDVVAVDVRFQLVFPGYVGHTTGREELVAGLRGESPSRTFDRFEVQPTRDGFLVDYAYRTATTQDQPSMLSVGLISATVQQGFVTRAVVTCAGGWDAEEEARIYGRTPATVS